MRQVSPINRRTFLKTSLAGSTGLLSTDVLSNQTALPHHLVAAKKAKTLPKPKHLIIMLPTGCEKNVQPVIDLFTQHTGVKIKILSVPVDDINTQMFLSASTNNYTYDIALPATFGIPDLAQAKAIADLSQYREKHEPEGFMESALYTIGDFYKEKFYGYQTDGDTYMMFYNQTPLETPQVQQAFEDHFGYTYTPPQTWQELDQHMAFFHQPEKGQYGGALFRTENYMTWEWWCRFHAKGQLPLDDNLTPKINTPEAIQALDELLLASKHQYPQARINGLFANWEAYAKGNIYANIGWGGTQKHLNGPNSKVKGKMLFGATPGGKINGKLQQFPYFNWGWNYTVSNITEYQELSYLFILFATSPVPSTISVRERDGFFDPYREEHYSDEKIIATYTKPFLDSHKASMKTCFPDFYLSGQSSYFGELRKFITQAQEGIISTKQALNTTAKLWEKTHKKQGIEEQKKQWKFLKKQYPSYI